MSRKIWTQRHWRVDAAGTGLCGLITFLVIACGLVPMSRRRSEERALADALAEKQSIIDEQASELSEVNAELEQARLTLRQHPFRLISAREVNVRIAEMAALATDAGLKLDEIEPGEPRLDPRFERIPIHLAGTGNYPACVAMLHRLRRNFPDTTVVSLDLQGDPADARTPAEFRMSLIWHAASPLQATARH